MGTFSSYLEAQKIDPAKLLATSARLEAGGKDGRALLKSRAIKRRTDEKKTYADAGLKKPPTGRGIGPEHLQAAMKDQPLPRMVRAKLVRAISALVSKKGAGSIDTKTLFGEAPAKKGKKVEKAAVA